MLCRAARGCPRHLSARKSCATSKHALTPGLAQFTHARCRNDIKCNGKFGDELLDFVTAGPKLRKWYGQGQLPQDGGDYDPEQPPPADEAEEDDEVKDTVLVTDAESPTGEQVLLQLILSRANVKAIVNDVAKAKVSYGPYVTPLSLDIGDQRALRLALKGVKTAVVGGRLGSLPQVAKQAGLQHLVLVSSAGLQASDGFSLGSLFGSADGVLSDPAREAQAISCGVPCTIVKAINIRDAPGGKSRLEFVQDKSNKSATGPISRQDVALVAVKAVEHIPQDNLTFQVVADGPGAPPSDWDSIFASISPRPAATASSQA